MTSLDESQTPDSLNAPYRTFNRAFPQATGEIDEADEYNPEDNSQITESSKFDSDEKKKLIHAIVQSWQHAANCPEALLLPEEELQFVSWLCTNTRETCSGLLQQDPTRQFYCVIAGSVTLESVERQEHILRRLNAARMSHIVENPNVVFGPRGTSSSQGETPLRDAEKSAAAALLSLAQYKFNVQLSPSRGIRIGRTRVVIVEVAAEGLTVEYVMHKLPLNWLGSPKAEQLERRLLNLSRLRRRPAGSESSDHSAYARYYRRNQAHNREQDLGRDNPLPKGTKTSVEYSAISALVQEGSLDVVG